MEVAAAPFHSASSMVPSTTGAVPDGTRSTASASVALLVVVGAGAALVVVGAAVVVGALVALSPDTAPHPARMNISRQTPPSLDGMTV
jgi:hypothetical protein